MDKTEIVMVSQIENIYGGESKVNEWLLKNPHLEVMNVTKSSTESLYIIHYKTKAKWEGMKYALLEKPNY